MSEIVLEPVEDKTVPVRDLISIVGLILGTILISVGSFAAWGIFVGLFTFGILLVIVSLFLGWNR